MFSGRPGDEIIHADHFVALGKEQIGEMGPEESRAAGIIMRIAISLVTG